MRNSYPGICYRCKEKVEAGEGHFERVPKELRKKYTFRWFLQHAKCAIYFRGTDVGKSTEKSQ